MKEKKFNLDRQDRTARYDLVVLVIGLNMRF